MKNRALSSICLALGLITLAIFWPALGNAFLIYDDQQYVTENPHVRAGLSWAGVVWAFKSFYASNWHPLTWFSHMLDCQFFGLKPAGHHLTNIVLHGLNTLLVFAVINRLTGAIWRSAMVAALFGWHPLHVESVAWVAERKDVLSAFFFLLTIWAYAEYVARVEGRGNSKLQTENLKLKFRASLWYLAMLALFALGLMSKPMVVTLPFVLLLLDYWPLRRCQPNRQSPKLKTFLVLFLEKSPFLVLAALACIVTVSAQGRAYSIVSTGALPVSIRVFHAAISYFHYLGATFLPRHLAVYYPYEHAEGVAEGITALGSLALITLFAFRVAARRPYLLIGWLWFLGMLVPVIGLVQVGDQAWADRYTYLPLIGVFIAIVWGGFDLAAAMIPNAGPRTILAAAITTAVGLALLSVTSLQLRNWRSSRSLFEHAAAVTHKNARAITMLGSLLADEGKLEEAKTLYAQALGYNPHEPEAHFSLGKVLARQGRVDEAIAEYTQALWSRPLREQAQIFIGMALAKQKRYAEAATRYQAALEVNPESAAAHNNLARLLHTQGRFEDATIHYSAALKADPDLAEAHNNLGILLLQQGRPADGAVQLRQALRLKPGDPESLLNLAQALVQQEQWREAADLFGKTVTAATADPNIHYQFATALAHLRQTRLAMSQYAGALLLEQDFPAALNGLAWILATDADPQIRNGDQAYAMAERACALTGRKDPEKLKTLAATCAESGRFSQAVFDAQAALDLAVKDGQNEVAGECRLMIEAFRAGKPWREPR